MEAARVQEKSFVENIGQIENLKSSLGEGVAESLRSNVNALAAALDSFLKQNHTLLAPEVQDQVFVDTPSRIAFLEPYVPASVRVLQDCYDPEAQLRQSVHWQNLGTLHGNIVVHEVPEFRPTAIGGAIAHYLGELARNGYRGLLGNQEVVYSDLPVIFIGNAAPRTGTPMQGGAPFVHARLGFNIFYFGTNTEELGCLKPFLIGNPREIFVDECSTFRSRFLGKRVAEWRVGDLSHFGSEIAVESISTGARGAILFVDNFGNVKINLTGRELEALVGATLDSLGQKPMHVRIHCGNGRSVRAQVVRKLEDGKNGSLLIAIGSSRANLGRDDLDNTVDCYLKGNPDGRSAAQVLLETLHLEVSAGTPRHLFPLPGQVLSLERTTGDISQKDLGILASLLG